MSEPTLPASSRRSIQLFAQTFFQQFGAQVVAQEDELMIDLPPDLATAFGKARLYLVIPSGPGQTRDLSPTEDLLVYGSRIFDQMLALLRERGERAHLHFPLQVSITLDHIPPAFSPLAGYTVLETQADTYQGQFYLFNFRAVYVSDEKQEAFFTVVLDAEGQPRPELSALATEAEPLLDSPAQAPNVEPEQLRQLLDRATETAHHIVEAHIAELEIEIQARLEKTLLRLTGYYQRLMDEVKSDDPARDETVRTDLQQDLDRKIADELERYHLQVTVSPVSYATAFIPFAHYHVSLTTPRQQADQLPVNADNGPVKHLDCQPCTDPVPPGVAGVEPKSKQYRWNRADGQTYVVYIGKHLLRGLSIVVTDKPGRAVYNNQVGIIDWLFKGNGAVQNDSTGYSK